MSSLDWKPGPEMQVRSRELGARFLSEEPEERSPEAVGLPSSQHALPQSQDQGAALVELSPLSVRKLCCLSVPVWGLSRG